MNILIDNKSGEPIYNQIYSQIKNQIIGGVLILGFTLFNELTAQKAP